MRSERKKGRSLLARLMVLMMIINLLSGINPSAVRADNATDIKHFGNNGQKSEGSGITLTETAKNYNNGEFDVDLLLKSGGKTTVNEQNLDVVLVVDRSYGMKDNNKMVNAKKAASEFVDNLLKDNHVRVGLVSFGGRTDKMIAPKLEPVNLQKDKTTLKEVINKFEPYNGYGSSEGGTFTQAALRKANELFGDNNTNRKIIVVISDGEPTYAYSGSDVADIEQIERAYSNIQKPGYVIKSHNKILGWKDGFHKNWLYTPYYVKLVPGIIGIGHKMTDEVKRNTISEATKIKNENGVEIFSVGIGVDNSGRDVLTKVASQGRYYDSNMSASNLDDVLAELKKIITEYNVEKGILKVVMNDKVALKSNLGNLVLTAKNTKPNATQEEKDSLNKRVDEIKNNWTLSGNTITLNNITLGENEELTLTYKAELKEEWMDGSSYTINNTAEVLPKGNPNNSVSFIIPTVKDTKTVNIVVNKTWVGNRVPTGVNEVKFNITSEAPAMNNIITVKETENWSGTLNALPKYKNGKKINYKVTEVAGNNYEIVGNIEETTSANGDLVFTAKNKNTEKVTFIVEKKWGTTPSELQFPAKVQLYANNNKAELKTFSNNEAKFTDLAKYDADGNEIQYTVKEVNEEGTEEKDGKITNKGFDYTVSHTDEAYVSTITNTCTNPQAKEFTATITKKWEGGIGKEVTFLFNDKNGNKYGEIKLERKDNQGDTWTGNINLAKYNYEGKELTYIVTEKEIAGFTSDNPNGIEISAANPNATFTNTRNTKNIKVTKVWKDTPDSLKTDVEVVLYENSNPSNRQDAIKKITKDGNGTVEYTGLPVTDEDGNEIAYTVKENNFDSALFNSEVTSDQGGNLTITNTYTKLTEDTISVKLVKEWLGSVGRNATFKFTDAAGNVLKELTLNANTTGVTVAKNNGRTTWEITVSDLRKYDNNAKPIQYKVSEVISNKAFELHSNNDVAFNDGDTVKFANTRVMRMLTLNKKWVGPVAEKAVFKITPSDKKVELNASKNWKDTIDLPVYDLDGKVIVYTVTEEEVEGYKAKEKEQKFSFVDPASQLVDKEFTFTNVKYTDEAHSTFTINKTWKSDFKQNVAFGLFDDSGKKIGHIVTLTKDNAVQGSEVLWSRYFITDPLPEFKEDSSKITYEIKEMDGLDDNAKPIENNKITIGNRTYAVERRIDGNIYNFTNKDITTGNVKATKIWEGTPSTEAKFGLFKKGTNNKIDVAPEVETKDNGREVVMTFKNLPFADADGKAVEYEVREMNATGDILNTGDVLAIGNKEYKVSYKEGNDGVIITNTELIKITVNKIWGDNVPGIAKKAIKFRVLGGYLTGGTLSAENNWTWTSGYLPLYDHDNNKINYSVVETEINGEKIDLNQGFATDTDGNTVYYHKAFKITLEGAKDITESKTVNITNSIREAEQPQDSNNRIIHIVKDWTVNAKKKNVKVKLYKLDTAKGEIVAVEGKEVELTEANKWMAELEVPKADNGEEIVYYAFETAIGDDSIDESKLSPNLYNDGYRIGEYNVNITELTSDSKDAKFGDYGFYILNESDNNPVQPEEKVTINVTKQWAIPTTSEYVKPVKVRLFVENGGNLVPVFGVNDLTLNADNGWKGKFENLDKTDYDGNEINYHVAEVGIEGEQDKEIMSLSDMLNVNGYTIGKYHVVIDGDGTQNVVITNDVKLIDVTAVKHWLGIVPRYAVQFTLYSSHDNTFDSTGKVATLDGTDNDLVATFKDLPALDSNGKPIVYYVFETKIGDAVPTFNALAEATTNYPVNVTGGRYNVVITDNGTVGEKVVIIQNSYVANSGDPVVPIIPGLDPGTTPGTTPGTIPGTTPALDVPDDATPQGDANIKTPDDTNEDEDGFVEVDEDETPQGKANVKDNTNANDAKRKETTDIEDDSTPQGNTALPKTGGTARDFLGIIGMGLIGLGLVFKKRKH